jgi:hypothetical protein
MEKHHLWLIRTNKNQMLISHQFIMTPQLWTIMQWKLMNFLQQLNHLQKIIHHHQVHLLLHHQSHPHHRKQQVVNQKFVKVPVVMVVNVLQLNLKQQHQCLVKNRQQLRKEKVVHQQQDRKHQLQHHQLFKHDQVIVVRRNQHVIENEVFPVEVMKKKLKMMMKKRMILILLKKYFPISPK